MIGVIWWRIFLEPSGPVHACKGTDLPLTFFTIEGEVTLNDWGDLVENLPGTLWVCPRL